MTDNGVGLNPAGASCLRSSLSLVLLSAHFPASVPQAERNLRAGCGKGHGSIIDIHLLFQPALPGAFPRLWLVESKSRRIDQDQIIPLIVAGSYPERVPYYSRIMIQK
ncbi:uncharacterized protein APUU_11957S [Aspergillus puulaauensis]|uniref:Uncharacterized protein n=1 Tax=Aspergillus puulaauensis TaxID=1220207 RepID=A0A7R7XD45_9EURO|nr:uncharacterized protein APUU_11957S [Aspergillus puulaauensis]BCS19129.1 hypothetical protein APUU_11957S [Aspergillus puulaauensis]